MKSQGKVQKAATFAVLASCAILGFAGTDMILPVVPVLPAKLGGSQSLAQLTLAGYAGGFAIGVILLGRLGARFQPKTILASSLAAFALAAWVIANASDLLLMVALRMIQGAAAASGAVLAPVLLRAAFPGQTGMRALGMLASLESLAPAFAPVLGAWLFSHFGWRAPFEALAIAAAFVFIGVMALRQGPAQASAKGSGSGSYTSLLHNREFLRYTLSHGASVASLLIFVFGAPAVFVTVLDLPIEAFIAMQITGIAGFILASNLTHLGVSRFGASKTIVAGTMLQIIGSILLIAYGLAGGRDPILLVAFFVPMNIGLGLRAPPGFYLALEAAKEDEARGSALVLLSMFGTTALGAAASAPLLSFGLAPLAAISLVMSVLALIAFIALHDQA